MPIYDNTPCCLLVAYVYLVFNNTCLDIKLFVDVSMTDTKYIDFN